MKNQCDAGHETPEEIRRLPTGGDGAVLICKTHYFAEMEFRRERISRGAQFKLPEWNTLKIDQKGA